MIKNGRAILLKTMVIMAVFILALLTSTTALAVEDGLELELDIRLVGESDSPDQYVNIIALPDFNVNQQTNVNSAGNSGDKLTGQEKSAQAKSQAYGLIKEDKKEKIKKEKVKKDKKEKKDKEDKNI